MKEITPLPLFPPGTSTQIIQFWKRGFLWNTMIGSFQSTNPPLIWQRLGMWPSPIAAEVNCTRDITYSHLTQCKILTRKMFNVQDISNTPQLCIPRSPSPSHSLTSGKQISPPQREYVFQEAKLMLNLEALVLDKSLWPCQNVLLAEGMWSPDAWQKMMISVEFHIAVFDSNEAKLQVKTGHRHLSRDTYKTKPIWPGKMGKKRPNLALVHSTAN